MSSCSSHRSPGSPGSPGSRDGSPPPRRKTGAAAAAAAAAVVVTALALGAPVALVALVSAPEPTVPATSAPVTSGPVQRVERFRGTLQVGGKSVSVAIDTWLISNGQKIDSLALPFRGSLVVELRGGSIVTIIGGRRVKRRPGEFWTVPAGTGMALETEDDSAAISTTVVADAG